ncbi:peptidase S8/S53 domain-containing protein [Trichoderma sp. SZMC 28012]
MAWFRTLALFLFTLTPYVTALPLKTTKEGSVLDVDGLADEDWYIVTLHKNISPTAFAIHLAKINDTYHHNSLNDEQNRPSGVGKTFAIGDYRGYSGVFDKDTIALLWKDADVAEIERDEFCTIQGKVATQRHAPWGLAALSSKKPGGKSYRYDKSAGNGTFAYVVDSGVFTKHDEFGGRASVGYSVDPSDLSDVEGHGTHVAGVIAGKTFGVAKQAEIIGVKVLSDGVGLVSDVLEGFSWAVQDIVLKGRQNRSVINLSIASPFSIAFNRAVDAAFELGILSVVAARNAGMEARKMSPVSAAEALAVGAINSEWTQTIFSNFGPEVNIQAPGYHIESAYIGTENATNIMSGTSMSAPHVAGLALYLAALENTTNATQLRDRILELGVVGKAKELTSDTPNLVAHNGAR